MNDNTVRNGIKPATGTEVKMSEKTIDIAVSEIRSEHILEIKREIVEEQSAKIRGEIGAETGKEISAKTRKNW